MNKKFIKEEIQVANEDVGKEFCLSDNQRDTNENKDDAIIAYQICKD